MLPTLSFFDTTARLTSLLNILQSSYLSPPPPHQASTEAGIKATPSCPMGSVLSQSGARLHLSPLLDSSDYFLSHIFPMARCLGCYPGTSPAKYEEVSSVSRPQFFVLSHSEGNHRMDSPHQITRLG